MKYLLIMAVLLFTSCGIITGELTVNSIEVNTTITVDSVFYSIYYELDFAMVSFTNGKILTLKDYQSFVLGQPPILKYKIGEHLKIGAID